MPARLFEVITSQEVSKDLIKTIQDFQSARCWTQKNLQTGETQLSILLPSKFSQQILQILQAHLGTDEKTQTIIFSPEATVPSITQETDANAPNPLEKKRNKAGFIQSVSREEIYNNVLSGAELTGNYVLLILFSTLVAAIGVMENNMAVLIGAMLIAPMLGPNLAFSFGAATGDTTLMLKAMATNISGVVLSIVFAFLIGIFVHYGLGKEYSHISAQIGYDSVFVALSAGAAGVLSLISGLPSTLVGVMVAVALLPPAAAAGLSGAMGLYKETVDALLLLFLNIVCINLAANILFVAKGIKPDFWKAKQVARKSMIMSTALWIFAFIVLSFVFMHAFTGKGV